MQLAQKYPKLGSSVDPQKLSLTIKSLGVALVPLILAILRFAGNESIVDNDVIQVINSIATIVAMAGVIWGVARKFKNNG